MSVDRALFFQLMGSFASGVTIITSREASGAPRGFTASAFCSLSLEPMLCMVAVDRKTESLPSITDGAAFGVNILAHDQEELSRRFASKILDKFEGVAHTVGPATGVPVLDGVLAWIECRVVEVLPGGDHLIVVGEVVNGDARAGEPLLYFRAAYRRLA